ncbi:MAG: hypothetical protein R3F11_06460 [Verrucomicrobiales bacterium]
MGGNIAEIVEHAPSNLPGATRAKGGSFLSATSDDLIRNRGASKSLRSGSPTSGSDRRATVAGRNPNSPLATGAESRDSTHAHRPPPQPPPPPL